MMSNNILSYLTMAAAAAGDVMPSPTEKPCKVCRKMTAYTVRVSEFGRLRICEKCAEK